MDLNIPERSRIFPHASGAVEQYRVKILNQRQGDGRASSYGADAFSHRLPAIEDFRHVVPPGARKDNAGLGDCDFIERRRRAFNEVRGLSFLQRPGRPEEIVPRESLRHSVKTTQGCSGSKFGKTVG